MPEFSRTAVQNLLAPLKVDLLQRETANADLVAEIAAILRNWPRLRVPAEPVIPQRLPACRHLEGALAAALTGEAANIAENVAPLANRLLWSYGYPFQPRWPDLASTIAFSQIVGPRGIMDDESLHLGLTLMAPETHYPMHSHPAVETYLVLSGAALWRIAGAPFTPRPPGDLILHASDVGHAMMTTRSPLLALYVWRGDLVTPPRYTDEAAEA